jgi:hypothetical protein
VEESKGFVWERIVGRNFLWGGRLGRLRGYRAVYEGTLFVKYRIGGRGVVIGVAVVGQE